MHKRLVFVFMMALFLVGCTKNEELPGVPENPGVTPQVTGKAVLGEMDTRVPFTHNPDFKYRVLPVKSMGMPREESVFVVDVVSLIDNNIIEASVPGAYYSGAVRLDKGEDFNFTISFENPAVSGEHKLELPFSGELVEFSFWTEGGAYIVEIPVYFNSTSIGASTTLKATVMPEEEFEKCEAISHNSSELGISYDCRVGPCFDIDRTLLDPFCVCKATGKLESTLCFPL